MTRIAAALGWDVGILIGDRSVAALVGWREDTGRRGGDV